MIVPGDTITCWATVTGTHEKEGLGFVDLDVGMRLQNDVETCPGTATIVLPIRGGDRSPTPSCRRRRTGAATHGLPGSKGRHGTLDSHRDRARMG